MNLNFLNSKPLPFILKWLIKNKSLLLLIALFVYGKNTTHAQVKYLEGAINIDGVQLFQSYNNPNAYYYLPSAPRLSTRPDGIHEISFIKYLYVGKPDTLNGGLFHALFKFDLPKNEIAQLQKKLSRIKSGAKIQGMVPLANANAENDGYGFSIVSSIINSKDKNSIFESEVHTSKHAPLLAGSKAALSVTLNQYASTVLWESLQSPTSDVSILVNAYVEVITPTYLADIQLDEKRVFQHFMDKKQEDKFYSKNEISIAVDSIVTKTDFKINIVDVHSGTDKNQQLDALVQYFTDKVTDIMFRAEGVAYNAKNPGVRYQRKKLQPDFLKSISFKIRKSEAIKIPVVSAFNLSTFFEEKKEESNYFQVIKLNDPHFQSRRVTFKFETDYLNTLENHFSSVVVKTRKMYPDSSFIEDEIYFDVAKNLPQVIEFPRGDMKGQDWKELEYQLIWNVKEKDEPIFFPAGEARSKWKTTDLSVVTIRPPLERKSLVVDIDNSYFDDLNITTCEVLIQATIFGEEKIVNSFRVRKNTNVEQLKKTIYYDKGTPLSYKIKWHSTNQLNNEDFTTIDYNVISILKPQ